MRATSFNPRRLLSHSGTWVRALFDLLYLRAPNISTFFHSFPPLILSFFHSFLLSFPFFEFSFVSYHIHQVHYGKSQATRGKSPTDEGACPTTSARGEPEAQTGISLASFTATGQAGAITSTGAAAYAAKLWATTDKWRPHYQASILTTNSPANGLGRLTSSLQREDLD